LTSSSSRVEKIARVGALVVAALVVEACSKKKGKANGPNELEMVLLGYYIKFGPRNQESRVSFRINGYDTVRR